MPQYYDITLANDYEHHTFTYELLNTRTAKEWAIMIHNSNVDDLRKSFNSWQGAYVNWDERFKEFMHLIQRLNEWIPDKIQDTWDDSDRQSSLNRYHIHFPKHYYVESDIERIKQLDRYNEIIHELEIISRQIITGQDNLHLLLIPLYNGKWEKKYLELSDYADFVQERYFGDLLMAYCHVGRHPMEIFHSRDNLVPTEQILCQTDIGPLHYLMFSDSKFNKSEFDKYYYDSHIKWPYALDDPRLAVGFSKIGNLISFNGTHFSNTDINKKEIYNAVKRCNKIEKWLIRQE